MARGKFQTLKEALSDFHPDKQKKYAPGENWREKLPPGSRWSPGSNGRADCQACKGTGFVSFDVGINHPKFGKLYVCDCVAPNTAARLNENIERQFYR